MFQRSSAGKNCGGIEFCRGEFCGVETILIGAFGKAIMSYQGAPRHKIAAQNGDKEIKVRDGARIGQFGLMFGGIEEPVGRSGKR